MFLRRVLCVFHSVVILFSLSLVFCCCFLMFSSVHRLWSMKTLDISFRIFLVVKHCACLALCHRSICCSTGDALWKWWPSGRQRCRSRRRRRWRQNVLGMLRLWTVACAYEWDDDDDNAFASSPLLPIVAVKNLVAACLSQENLTILRVNNSLRAQAHSHQIDLSCLERTWRGHQPKETTWTFTHDFRFYSAVHRRQTFASMILFILT